MDLYDRAAYKFEGGLGALYALSFLISLEWLHHICILHSYVEGNEKNMC